jgi:3-oxoacyl-[acyl-carrier protein] reductase
MADSQTKRLTGKVAVITGSGRGIGRCEALLMAQQGAKVIVSDIGTDAEGASTAGKVAAEIRAASGEAVSCADNVATIEGARRTVDTAVQSYGRLDILVNNAGLRAGNPIDKLTEEQWTLVLDSHLKASFAMTKFAVPVFKRQGGGVIVNTGSEAGLGMIFNSAYAAAKEGIAGLTRSVAREQGRFGIRCNMIRPDLVARVEDILSRLDIAEEPADLDLPGYGLHSLRGNLKGFWSVTVSRNWRIIFRFEGRDATEIDFMDYH